MSVTQYHCESACTTEQESRSEVREVMARTLETLSTTLPTWMEIIEADDGQYHVMDNSFDDGAMELACFHSPDHAMRFAMRLAGRRAGLLQQR